MDLYIGIFTFVIGLIGGIFTGDIRREIGLFLARKFPKYEGLNGVYVTLWNKGNNQPQTEFIEIFQSKIDGNNFSGSLLYSLDPASQYNVNGSFNSARGMLAVWENQITKISGYFHLSGDHYKGEYKGWWSGPSSKTNEINSDRFKMYRREKKRKILPEGFSIKESECTQALKEIVIQHLKHEENPDWRKVEFDGYKSNNKIVLEIGKEVFDPSLGSISTSLFQAAQKINPKKVLDLGCGSGYHSIAFALNGSTVIASDISPAAYECTIQNVNLNGVKDKVTIFQGDLYKPLYDLYTSGESFDLIIANLPFTRPQIYNKCFTSENTKKQFQPIFCSRKGLFRELILGAEFFLKSDGHLVFSFGASGFHDDVNKGVSLSSLKINEIYNLNLPGEDCRILDLIKD